MLYETSQLSTSNTTLNNCIIESFGIHARCLRDFLFNMKREKNDDMLAVDFLDNITDWKQHIMQNKRILENLDKRVGKELAHLTYERVGKTSQEKHWPKNKIVNDINIILREFLKAVPSERLCEELIMLKNSVGQ